MPSRLSSDKVVSAFNAAGYTLLESYRSCEIPIKFTCPNGHNHQISWANFSQGKRCRFCNGGTKNREFIRNEFVAAGYVLLTDIDLDYKDSNTPLEYICESGHKGVTNWLQFKRGRRCMTCHKNRVTHDMVQKAFSLAGYELLDTYKKANIPLKATCPFGHLITLDWNHFSRGARCLQCFSLRRGDAFRLSQEDVEDRVKAKGFTLLSSYKTAKELVRVKCPAGHEFSRSWDKLQARDFECSKCLNRVGGFCNKEPGFLYYIRFFFEGSNFYKIGITNHSLAQRFMYEPLPYEVIQIWEYESGLECRRAEREILRRYKSFRYKGASFLASGNTELFTRDVLNLDKDAISCP
jgi:hypothetical protein